MRGRATMLVGLGFLALGSVSASVYHGQQINKRCYESSAQLTGHTIERRSIDQVFRDHYGWRLYSHDKKGDGRVEEEKFWEPGHNLEHGLVLSSIPEARELKAPGDTGGFVVYKDLPEGEQPNAVIVRYRLKDCNFNFDHVEVHLPPMGRISPGIDYNRDTLNPRHPPMQEVR